MGELTAAVAFCVATSWWMSRWFSCSSARRLSLSTGPPITALGCLFCGPPCNKWILNLRRATSHTGKRLETEIWGRRSPEILQGNISKLSSSLVAADGEGGAVHRAAALMCSAASWRPSVQIVLLLQWLDGLLYVIMDLQLMQAILDQCWQGLVEIARWGRYNTWVLYIFDNLYWGTGTFLLYFPYRCLIRINPYNHELSWTN